MNTWTIDETKEQCAQSAHLARSNTSGRTPRINSDCLLGADGMLEIMHNGSVYQLRQTSTGKLILTK
ncbi:hemin uptake protein HemP [Burkholderiaceae bacterium DAT-1]|nr:hemin uptake protein HemP [Burkholderiaceae bacterium DAT-1]